MALNHEQKATCRSCGATYYRAYGHACQTTLVSPERQPAPLFPAIKNFPKLTEAAKDILAERERQMQVEGWTPEHDDQHTVMELATAAGCYALSATPKLTSPEIAELFEKIWPWDRNWFKPGSHRRNCVKAAALLLAEIERLDREEAKHTSPGGSAE